MPNVLFLLGLMYAGIFATLVAVTHRKTNISYLFLFPATAALLISLGATQPPVVSGLTHRTIIGPVIRTSQTVFNTQTGQYYGRLNALGYPSHDGSMLGIAPVGSYIILQTRTVAQS